MGVLIESDNFYVNNILDVLLIFGLGMILLFMVYLLKFDSKYFVSVYSGFVIFLCFYFLIFINKELSENKKNTNNYNIINFVTIYSIVLSIFLIVAVHNL